MIGTCFKYPFSSTSPSAELADKKRNIILVGHDVDADIRFLRKIGYEINNLQLHEACDTTTMWKALKREINPRSLAGILAELGITGWNLHNAGNDAVYTLQAMLGIACKHLVERNKERAEKDKLKRDRISEYVCLPTLCFPLPHCLTWVMDKFAQYTDVSNRAVKEAAELAYEREDGWSTDGSDGGERVTLEQAKAKRADDEMKKAASKRTKITDVDQLWRDGSRSVTGAASSSTLEPILVPAENFGYSSQYKSPYYNAPVSFSTGYASITASSTGTNITALEQSMQNVSLTELQTQGRIPMDRSANASRQLRKQEREADDMDSMITDADADVNNTWPTDPKRKRRVKR